MSEGSYIVDTVVLLYFLLVGQERLLGELLGKPLRVPLAVYDPDDRTLPTGRSAKSEFLSEMRQSVRHYESAAASAEESEAIDHEIESFTRIKRVDDLYDEGSLVPAVMTPSELSFAARLQSTETADYGLRVPLGPGEAACVAISFQRGWTIATDDSDALKVLDQLHGDRPYPKERVRKLLIRAADEGRITPIEANRLPGEMRSLGFWDTGQPFD